MVLEIAQLGQPVLRERAEEIPAELIGNPQFQEFLREMKATLTESKGVGLAAPQVFVGQRVFLAAILPPTEEEGPPGVEVFINPKLTPLTDEKTRAWEGCLSFQELLVLVPRHRAVRIDYVDATGTPKALAMKDFPARVVQHEFDHLEGVLTIDRAEAREHIIKATEIDTAREMFADDEEEEDDENP
jgi:peptide deformylase